MLTKVLVMDDVTPRSLDFGGSMSTSEVDPTVRAALRSLLLVLADPDASLVALDLLDEVADVVTDLIDVNPPLPPLTYPERGAEGDEHALELVCSAIADLETAVEVSAHPPERLRTAIAARRLRAVIGRWRR